MKKYDVVIVGGGGAGLFLARELTKKKYQVLILDQKKDLLDFSFYTLGSFINPDEFDFSRNIIAQQIDEICVKSKRLQSIIKCHGFTLDKRIVHQELLDAIDKDFITYNLGTQIKTIENKGADGYVKVVDKKGMTYEGKIFVDATGTAGVLSKKVGLQSKTIQLATGVEYNVKYKGKTNQIFLLLGKTYKGGYGWIFPLKNGRGIIGFGTTDDNLKKGLKERLNAILELPDIKKLVEKDNQKIEGGSIPITPVLEKFVDQNLVCIGDSVSQVNPIAGEGYKFIFESARMAGKAIDEALQTKNIDTLNGYEREWKERFLSNYKRSKVAQERINSFSKKDLFVDFGILLLKMRSNSKNFQSISGEYK